LLILESGAGGYAAEASRACKLAAEMGSYGWLFHCGFGGFAKGRGRGRRGRIIELALITEVGTPDVNALAGALRAAGKRHGVLYQLIAALPSHPRSVAYRG
jgi:hypothetical protein